MVREQRRVLVATFAEPFEPVGEPRVQPRTSRLCEPVVCDLARQRMLEDVFDLPFERRARPAADEVATLECAQIRFQPGDELVHRSRPERAADHRRCLEGRLVGLPEQVDARGEDRLHRVRDVEAGRQLRRVPRTVRPLEDAGVDQAAEHFLDEERVSLRALHDEPPHRCRELGGE